MSGGRKISSIVVDAVPVLQLRRGIPKKNPKIESFLPPKPLQSNVVSSSTLYNVHLAHSRQINPKNFLLMTKYYRIALDLGCRKNCVGDQDTDFSSGASSGSARSATWRTCRLHTLLQLQPPGFHSMSLSPLRAGPARHFCCHVCCGCDATKPQWAWRCTRCHKGPDADASLHADIQCV
jgi:hypothetical protein